ncbi:hypothetical protein Q8A67_005540 [Cirrhinus molitorella]|uniref:Uncharacterized protein n=1 Tax=Cirrhinus molitorella TaxID=172907 RepID=A0AA88Q418_9TELE|nr:hypothetical protein Q8A67_005540 [Cirrhinus molitorella]
MPLPQDFFTKLHEFLKASVVFSSFPLSVLLIGLEALIDHHFSCPCEYLLNVLLTAFMFIGPGLFSFFLMVLHLRPFRHGGFHCPEGVNVDTQENWPKALISCLIPPAMWIFLLFLDGDYLACAMTDWNGVYVFNKELNRSWCKPNSEHFQSYIFDKFIFCIHFSQFISYIWITLFSVLGIVLVGVYDCCISGKCDCCPYQLLCCCGRRETFLSLPPASRPTDSHGGGNRQQRDNLELQDFTGNTASCSTDPPV